MDITKRTVDKYTQIIEFDVTCPKCKKQVLMRNTTPSHVSDDNYAVTVAVQCQCSMGSIIITHKGDRILRPEIQEAIDEFEALEGGCNCMNNPPCGYCTHPGNIQEYEDDLYL